MVLTNYWWLLIWLFTAGILANYYFPKQPVKVYGETIYQWSIPAILLLVIPYVVWAGTRGSFADTNTYRTLFYEAPTQLKDISEFINNNSKDKGFFVLLVLIKSLVGESDVLYFTLIAAIQMFLLMITYQKYSSNLWISFFLFITSTSYLSWMFNGMRQFLAVCICFYSTKYILGKDYLKAVVLIIIASTIHGTAIIMLLSFFIARGQAWNKKTMFFIFLAIIAVFYVGNFTTILSNVLEGTQYGNIMESEIWISDDGTNILRVLVNAIPAILSFVGRKYIQKEGTLLINLCTNMSIIATGIYLVSMVTSGIYIGRLPIYMILFSYILLPWEIENLFTEESKRIVYVIMCIGYLLFFYYQMHFASSLL